MTMTLRQYTRNSQDVILEYDASTNELVVTHWDDYELLKRKIVPVEKYWQALQAFNKFKQKINYSEGQRERYAWVDFLKKRGLYSAPARWKRFEG